MVFPVKPSSDEYPKLILLISRQTTDRENKNQDVIQSIINSSNLGKAEIVDGADPAMKQQRDDLLKISGLGTKYPQIFVKESAWVQPEFVGDFQTVHDMNEKGTFNKKGVLGIDCEEDTATPAAAGKENTPPPAETQSRGLPGTSDKPKPPKQSGGMFCCLGNSAVDDSPAPKKTPAPKKAAPPPKNAAAPTAAAPRSAPTGSPLAAAPTPAPWAGGKVELKKTPASPPKATTPNTPTGASPAPAPAPWALGKVDLKKTAPAANSNAPKSPGGGGGDKTPEFAKTQLKKTPATPGAASGPKSPAASDGNKTPEFAKSQLKKTEPNKKEEEKKDAPSPATKSRGMFGGGSKKEKETPAPKSSTVAGSNTASSPAPAPAPGPRQPQSTKGTTVTYTTWQRFFGCLPRQPLG